MAFVRKTWKDRIVQYANRRLLTKSGGEVEQVTVTRDEGTVSVVGDKFDAATMNDLENRIDNAIDYEADRIEACETAISGKANKTWTALGSITHGGTGINVSAYSEILIVPMPNGTTQYSPIYTPKALLTYEISHSLYANASVNWIGKFSVSSNLITVTNSSITGWTSVTCVIYGR